MREKGKKVLMDIASILVQAFLGLVGCVLAYNANKIAKSNLELAQSRLDNNIREIFLSNYQRVTEACGLLLQHGKVTSEVKEMIWLARDEARLQLPKKIENYVDTLFEKIITPKDENELLKDILKEKPYEVYQGFLKINIKDNKDE